MLAQATETSPIDSLTPEARNHWVRLMTLMAIADGDLNDDEIRVILDRIRDSGLAGPSTRDQLETQARNLFVTVGRIGIAETTNLSLQRLKGIVPSQARGTMRNMLRDVILSDGYISIRQDELCSLVDRVWDDVR